MSTKALFSLAHAAKQCGEYEVANQIFAVLAHRAITGNVGDSGVYIGYEQDQSREDIISNLSDPDGAGYYDLPYLFSTADDYLCIPLPLVSRHFRNHIVWRSCLWSDREDGGHNRNHWRLGHNVYHRIAMRRDLRRRLLELVSQPEIDTACRVILREPEAPAPFFPEQEPVTDDDLASMEQWLGPATLAKLNMAVVELEEYEEA